MPWLRVLFLVAICLAALPLSGQTGGTADGVKVDKAKRTIWIDAKVAPRKINDEKYQGKIYPIEVVACWPYPKGQKAHETVVTIDAKPSAVHKALVDLGLKPGAPVFGDSKDPPQGPKVNVYIEVPDVGDGVKRVPIEKTMISKSSGKPFPKDVEFRFTGSVMSKPDPNKDESVYGADLTGTLIAIFPVTNQTVFQTSLTMKYERFLNLETNPKVLPKEGTAVKLVLQVPPG
jgi:hypothetical protein